MALKRPGNSRNDQSGRSSGRASKPGNGPKRASSPRGKSASGTDKVDFNKPAKQYSSDRGGSSSGSKPYESRHDGDKSSSSFSGGPGEKKSFSAKSRPYTGRPTDNDDQPKRSFGGDSSGEKKSFSPKGSTLHRQNSR